MTNDHRIDQLVRELSPDVAPRGADEPTSSTARELRSAIMSEPRTAPATGHGPTRRLAATEGRRRVRRMALVGAPVAAGIAAAAIVLSPSSPTGPRPAEAHALEISTEGDLVVARVSDPEADPARYAAEFAEHGLDVDLRLVPASPSAVGTVVHLDADADVTGSDDRPLEVIEAPGECTSPGGGDCPVGIRIPKDYENRVEIAFGRAAEPGEAYEATGGATAPGEALDGLDLTGMRVAEAVAVLEERGQEATQFRAFSPDSPETLTPSADEVPGDWYVHAADLYAPGEVVLFVGESPEPTGPQHPAVPPTGAPPDSPAVAELRHSD